MSVRSTRRFALLLFMLVSVLYFRCKPAPPTTTTTPPPAAKIPPNQKRYKPEIKVDVTKLRADPKIAVIWDNEPEGGANAELPYKSSNKKVKITWTASDPKFHLLVEFNDEKNCVIEKPDCKTAGKCTASVMKDVTENTPCTYKMLNGDNLAMKDEEGDIVVMPCCQ